LIVGIIIGAGIYATPPDVARGVAAAWQVPLIWLAGGLLTLCGALSYAELATAYPQQGGDYVYLSRAYGRWAGFLFGWIQLTIVRPADIAVPAFVFAKYAGRIVDLPGGYDDRAYAALAVIALTAINIVGVRQGKWTQNLLTVAKTAGLLLIVFVAFSAVRGPQVAVVRTGFPPLTVAFIFVLYTFGGWNEMAYVAAEVKNPQRNIVRALVLGSVAVTAVYVLVNLALMYALSYGGLANSSAVATDAIATAFPAHAAEILIAVLICVSALGGVNGLIFTGARISYAVGADHRVFRLLGRWSGKTGTPVMALQLQGLLALLLVVVFDSFDEPIIYCAAAVYTFYMATGLAVFVLRGKDRDRPRPYRVALYPLPTILFVGVCAFMIYGAVTYKPRMALLAGGIVLVGLIVYWVAEWMAKRPAERR